MMRLPLADSDRYATIDDDMAAELSRFTWHLVNCGGREYVRAYDCQTERWEFLHHRAFYGQLEIRLFNGRDRIDHRNGDGLDCRRENLRLCTAGQNQMNSAGQRRRQSRYKGVSPGRGTMAGKWKARIRLQGKDRHLGYFTSEEDAGLAYDREARRLFADYARLNFPDEL
jgi:hypothetical protein